MTCAWLPALALFNVPLALQTSNVKSMIDTFKDTHRFNQDVNAWDTGAVVHMQRMFWSSLRFNQPLGSWNTTSATGLHSVLANVRDQFLCCVPCDATPARAAASSSSFYPRVLVGTYPARPSCSGCVCVVCPLTYLLKPAFACLPRPPLFLTFSTAQCAVFNQDIDTWQTGGATTLAFMFSRVGRFNQPLSSWQTGSATSILSMFQHAGGFNQNIDSWRTGSLKDARLVFYAATSFNQPLDSWHMVSATDTSGMFRRAESFNQPLDSWQTGSVATFAGNAGGMFEAARVFNQGWSQGAKNWPLRPSAQQPLQPCAAVC